MPENSNIFDIVSYLLNKSKRELDAASYLIKGEFPSIAISRAWFSVYHSTRALLELLGEAPQDNERIIQQFQWRVVESGLAPVEQGKVFQDLYFHHLKVDKYYPDYYSLDDAMQIITNAANFVHVVSSIIEDSITLLEESKKRDETN